ncbi:hypothetical protein [Noviherbaspirillum galbum]|uniref:PilM protein n=1 Tax=Noviherbaspirillum galbum TaxID=2709383 RepID=A0A6B3SY03_9BURK|nr:hypothetical protein [Noviherbaspirillum galbum]NEX64525.1 hypothetical protein [Noviherbaspirillum galbum]
MNVIMSMLSLSLLFTTGMLINGKYLERELPRSARAANVEIGLYKTFMLLTSYYVTANRPPAGTISWQTIVQSSSTPDSMKNLALGSSWKAIVDSTGGFIICAKLDESATSGMTQLMQPAAAAQSVSSGGKNYLWYGDAGASATATQC